MNVTPGPLDGLLLIEPDVYNDNRGSFMETWSEKRLGDFGLTGFVQDNLSYSYENVLRGLHFQNPMPQAKLVHVIQGDVVDVVLDLRRSSPTFGQHAIIPLSGFRNELLFVPEGFAHGFLVLSHHAFFSYKCTAPYAPEHQHAIRWDDPELNILWPVPYPVLSKKDAEAPMLRDLPKELLFE